MANQKSDSPRNDLNARCSDISGEKCDWQSSGRNEDEVLRNLEQHGRQRHGVNLTIEQRDKARGLIRSSNQQHRAT